MSQKAGLPPAFAFSFEVDREDGEILSAYITVRNRKVKRTIEVVPDKANVDLGWHNEVVGIELLGPCSVNVIEKIAKDYKDQPLRKIAKHKKITGFLQPA
jgi:hypothetical protein